MDYATALLKGRGAAPAAAAAPAPKPIARPAPAPIAPPKAAASSVPKAAQPQVDPVEAAGPFGKLPVQVAAKIAAFAGPQGVCNLGVSSRYLFDKVPIGPLGAPLALLTFVDPPLVSDAVSRPRCSLLPGSSFRTNSLS